MKSLKNITYLLIFVLIVSLTTGCIDSDKRESNKLVDKASEQMEYERYHAAIEYCDQALDLNPGNEDAWVLRGLAYYWLAYDEKGLEAETSRYAKDAIDSYDRVFEITTNTIVLDCIAIYYSLLDEADKEFMCYNKISEINPEDAHIWLTKAYALRSLKRYDEGLECVDKAISLDSTMANSWVLKGEINYDLGEYRETIRCCEMALSVIDPDDQFNNYSSDYVNDLKEKAESALQ